MKNLGPVHAIWQHYMGCWLSHKSFHLLWIFLCNMGILILFYYVWGAEGDDINILKRLWCTLMQCWWGYRMEGSKMGIPLSFFPHWVLPSGFFFNAFLVPGYGLMVRAKGKTSNLCWEERKTDHQHKLKVALTDDDSQRRTVPRKAKRQSYNIKRHKAVSAIQNIK